MIVINEENKLFLENLGSRIKKIRETQNLSKVQLAFEINTGEKCIRELEKGKVNPTTLTLLKLSEALNVSIQDLFEF